MANYDYGNARMFGRKSRLLPTEQLELYTGLGTVGALLDELTETRYARYIDAALIQAGSLAAVGRMLNSLQTDLGEKLRSYYWEDALELINLWLWRYDIQNLKAVLRGTAMSVSPHEIRRSLTPLGELSEHILVDLLEQPNLGAVIDRLASLRVSPASPLVKARLEYGLDSPFMLELELDQWLFHQVQEELKRYSAAGKLAKAYSLEADLINLMTALRMVIAGRTREEWFSMPIEKLNYGFLPMGEIPLETLMRAATSGNLAAAVDILTASPYGPPLQEGLERARSGEGFSSFEAALKSYRLGWLSSQIPTDRLGISVPLGVLALEINEMRNLRWIANAIDIGLPQERIMDRLERAG